MHTKTSDTTATTTSDSQYMVSLKRRHLYAPSACVFHNITISVCLFIVVPTTAATVTTASRSTTVVKMDSPQDPAFIVTIDEAIERVGYGNFQRVVFWTIGIFNASDAIEVLLLSYLSIVLQVEWNLTNTERAFITASVFLGAFTGSLVLGKLGDICGRRQAFLAAASLMAVFGVLTATATSYAWILLFRSLAGVGVGALSVSYDVLAEFLPQKNRANGLIANFYFWSAGAVYVSLSAYVSLGLLGNNWRLLVLLCSVPCIGGMIAGIIYIPESPHWLVSTKGKPEEALEILRRIAKQNGLDPTIVFPPGTIIINDTSTRMEEETTTSTAEVASTDNSVDVETTPLKNMKDTNSVNSMTTTSDGKERTGYLWMFTKEWSWIMLNLSIGWTGPGFFYYGVILVLTQIFSHQHHGTFHFNYAAIIVSSSAEVAGLFVISPLLDSQGRRTPQSIAYLMGGVSVACLCFVHGWLQNSSVKQTLLLTMAFVARGSTMAAVCSTWVITPEILTTNVRSTGHGFLNGVARLTAAVSPFILQATTPVGRVVVICSVTALAEALAIWQLPETKGQVMGRGITQVPWYRCLLSKISS